ncbi:hypothetical protein RN001_002925 [Aquatica leii]|uniref:DUF4806 domain-containing protein n=1 Tax=Aquatica leii TaxID=1421715 RepID=A0AAN7Q5S7_9COLE|nr:hypothetical protein RN001_002925 [Aquatica leii]
MVPLQPFDKSSACSSPVSISLCSNIQGTTTPHSIRSFLSDEDFKTKMCRDISFIKINVIKLNQRIALVEAGPKQTICEDDVQSREDISIIKSTFPRQNNKDLAEVEAKLQAGPEFKGNLIRYYSSIGGHKVDEIVKLILRKLFSNQLASQYSWLRAKKKRVFSNLILAEVILSSLNANCAAANAKEKDIINRIKNWLRHASTKDKNNKYEKA